MALVLRVGTNSFPSLVLHRIRMGILGLGLGHRPVLLTHPNPLHPRTPSPNQELAHLPAGPHRLAIAVSGNLRRGAMVVGAVSSAWLETSSTPFLVGTRTPVQCLLTPVPVPTPCLEAGSQTPALVPSLEIGHLTQGANLLRRTVAPIQILGKRIPNRRPTTVQVSPSVQTITRARAVGIVTENRLTSGLRVTSEVTDEATLIARGREPGIELARGGTPDLGRIRNSTNYHPSRPEVTPFGSLGLNTLLPTSRAPSLTVLSPFCWYNNEKKS